MARKPNWIAAATLAPLLLIGCASNPIQQTAQVFYHPCPATEFWGVWWSPDGARLALLFYQRGREAQLGVLTPGAGFAALAGQIPGGKDDLRWSPDGQHIAFTARYANNIDLYAVDVETDIARLLTHRRQNDVQPVWSPDGSRLAYISLDTPPRRQNYIYLASADGSGEQQVLTTPLLINDVAWSPDGLRLAYSLGAGAIGTAGVDGSGQRQVTDGQGDDRWAAWSPDSQRIAFLSYRRSRTTIAMINADGSGLRQLAADVDERSRPAWLPDGRHVAYVSHSPARRLMVVDVESLQREELTPFAVEEPYNPPSWSPDGSRVAFVAYDHSNPNVASMEVYVMNRDGSGLKRVTDNPGKRICFEWPF